MNVSANAAAIFIFAMPTGDVTIVADGVTWVEMPCASNKSVVHVGNDVDLNYWMAHELGHTLGLADHIRSFDDPSIYVNPGRCPDDGYVGIMSYCTPRALWFGPQDVQMMQAVWPAVGGDAPAPATDAADMAASTASVATLTVRGVAPALAAGFPAKPAPAEFATQAATSALQLEVDPGQPPLAEAPPASAFWGSAVGAVHQSVRPNGKSGGGTDDGLAFFALVPVAIALGIGFRARIALWAPNPAGK